VIDDAEIMDRQFARPVIALIVVNHYISQGEFGTYNIVGEPYR
jgi:hypothetical protein